MPPRQTVSAAVDDARDHRVLVVAPIGRDAELIAAALARGGVSAAACPSVGGLVDELPRGVGAVVVTEESVDTEALERLVGVVQSQPPWSDLPIVVLTSADRVGGLSRGLARRLDGLANVTFLERPVRTMTLVSTAQSAMRARRRQYEVRDHLVERERAAAELRERAEHTERLNRAKDEFLAMLGHELRNPIGAITGAVGVLDRVGGREAEVRRVFEVIERQTRHLGRLVDDLLDVSRVTSGRIVLDRRPLNLGEIVTRCVSTVPAGRADDPRITVTADAVWVLGDETRLDQIVVNLLVNAVKYTPHPGEVEIGVTADAGDAVLCVRDTGVGIPADMLSRVFDLFFQVEGDIERTKGGLGIGLTLVRRLVELHGGTIVATSDGAGRGSAFTVRLPAIATPTARDEPAAPGDGHGDRLRIVLVEDNADSREMMAFMLRSRGHEVHEAVDGVAGAAEILRLKPDVAIVDLGLPGLDGYEVARSIRRDGTTAGVELIALTGYGRPEDRQHAMEAGFDAHLVKPIDPERLDAALVRGGGRARPRRPDGSGIRTVR